MTSATQGLQPEKLWSFFSKISTIPHCSKNETALSAYIQDLARNRGISFKTDSAGNLCLYLPGSAGYENRPATAIQCHLDMVCEKNDSADIDFAKDALRLIRSGDVVKADGTTLGADNGIGVAAALALCFCEGIIHGPLEILLTVDEETGLTGAFHLSPELLTADTLINLDHEDINTVCIGCAGGGGVEIFLPLAAANCSENQSVVTISVDGLRGGHSGLNIHENRANAVKILAMTLSGLMEFNPFPVKFSGGNKINAIPREAYACMAVDAAAVPLVRQRVQNALASAQRLYPHEPTLQITSGIGEHAGQCFCADSFKQAVNLIVSLPNGVLTLSREMPGLVETSNNVASVQTGSDRLVVNCMPRSSNREGIAAVTEQIRSVASLAGAKIQTQPPYPAWPPGTDSKILKTVREVFKAVSGRFPETITTHAGLECGMIGSKYQHMDMIAIGPTIFNAHSPDEAVHIGSVETFWEVLTKTLEARAKTDP